MKIEKPYRDGETIQWEGYRIQVDWMPGQTEFGCCLWLELEGRPRAALHSGAVSLALGYGIQRVCHSSCQRIANHPLRHHAGRQALR